MPAATISAVDDLVQRLLATENADRRHALIAHNHLTPEELHDAVMRLDAEAVRIIGVDPVRMERICRDALTLADQADDDFLRATVTMHLGDAFRFQGRRTEALEGFDAAQAVFIRLGRPVEAARTRIGWVWAAAGLGRFEEAFKAAHSARRVLIAHGQTFRVANLDASIGRLYLEQGQYRAALRAFTSARNLFSSLGEAERLNEARHHANRGMVLVHLGRHREAIAELEFARTVYEEMGETAGAARVQRSIGEYQMDLGHYAAALRALETAQATMRAVQAHDYSVPVALNLAECYLRLNRPSDALAALDDVDEELHRTGNPQDALGAAVRRVVAYLQLDRRDAALAVLDEAERRFPTEAIHHQALLAARRAPILLQESPEEALVTARRARALARRAGLRRLGVDALISEGGALLALGRIDEAQAAATRARRLAHKVDAASLLHRSAELLGRIAEARGLRAVACRQYTVAIQQLEREQRGVIFEFRDSFTAGRETAYGRLAALQLEAGRPAAALATAERAKSRALMDAISGAVELRPRGDATVRRLARELAAAREEYAAASARLSRSGHTPESEAESLTAMEARITALVHHLQIAGAGEDALQLSTLAPPSLPALDADTALIEFFVSGNDLLRFVLDAGGVRATIRTGVMPEIERLLRVFRTNLDATERADAGGRDRLALQARQILGRLHACLLGDLEGLEAYGTLVIVPHGLLHYLPFHALHDGDRYLVERFAVAYAPSATLYGVCRARARQITRRRGALILAHTAGGQLPHAADEAQTIGVILSAPVHVEREATRTLLERAGRTAAVIHVAAHGSFRSDAPLFSHIELADGPLTTADVFDLKLRARLVALSACETGRTEIGGGDELVGLTRAFLYAGAATLLVSQWRVDDASTAILIARFYQELAQGRGAVRALAAAQSAFINAAAPNGHPHPFYWAAFQVIGDDHGVQRRPPRAQEG